MSHILLPVRCPNCNFLNKFSVRDYEYPRYVIRQLVGLPCSCCEEVIYKKCTDETKEFKIIKDIVFATQRAEYWEAEIARLEKQYYELHSAQNVDFVCTGGVCQIK